MATRVQLRTVFADSLPHHELVPLTLEGIELGRRLFYDTRLSGNRKVSCATCHVQSMAFSDGLTLSSNGVSGHQQMRHSPGLINLAFGDRMFWDGGATNLETQLLGPLFSEDEMDADVKAVVGFLNTDYQYKVWFLRAFGTDSIQTKHLLWAIGQFERSLVSMDSHYDQVQAGKATFTEPQAKGYALYQKHCQSCHAEGLFTDYGYHNNGLDRVETFAFASAEDERWGRYRITLDSVDIGRYKTPTLRNVAASAPYMHDGRFATLEAVLQHYSEGVKPAFNSHPTLRSGLHLSQEDRSALLAFLHTLTDSSFLSAPYYANPW